MKKLKGFVGLVVIIALLIGLGYILRELLRIPVDLLRFDEGDNWI